MYVSLYQLLSNIGFGTSGGEFHMEWEKQKHEDQKNFVNVVCYYNILMECK